MANQHPGGGGGDDEPYGDIQALLDTDAVTVVEDVVTSFENARKRLRPGGMEGDGGGVPKKCFGCIYSFCKSIQPGSEVAMERLFDFFEANALSMDFDVLADEIHSMWLREIYQEECKAGTKMMDWPLEMVRMHLRRHHNNPALQLRLRFAEANEKQDLIAERWETTNGGVILKNCQMDIKYGQYALSILSHLDKMNASRQ